MSDGPCAYHRPWSDCPGDHLHDSWGPTRIQTHLCCRVGSSLPKALYEVIVHAFISRLVAMGLHFQQTESLQQAARAATVQQSPSAKSPPLVSAFKFRVVTFYHSDQLVWPLAFEEQTACKLLHKFQIGGFGECAKFSAKSRSPG